jgi:hypothetical protein
MVGPQTEKKTDLTADEISKQTCDNQSNTNEGDKHMKTWKVGTGTLSIGLIGLGILLLLNFSGVISQDVIQYAGPIYIILFGMEVIWSYLRHRDERLRFSSWSIIILIIVMITSATNISLPTSLDWQPRYLAAVEGKLSLDSEIKRVDVRIPSGKVEITGTTGQELSYEGNLLTKASSQEKAEEVLKSDWKVQKNGDTLEIILDQKEPKWSLSSIFYWTTKTPYLNVQIPQSLLTLIQTANGSVHVDSMNGDTDIKSSNGSITVINEHGNVKATTSNGSGTFTDVDGSVNVHTNNGSLTFTNITGAVASDTSNGSIKGSSMINGTWDCVTSNGRITLAIPEKTDAKIDAKTSNGSVGGQLEWQTGEKTHRSATIGAGTYDVSLKTSNGSVNVDFEN